MEDIYLNYFPELIESQHSKFKDLKRIYLDWNEKINVISRKDTEEFDVRHVLHSLAIAKFVQFSPNSEVLDFGTGGGFPGIPLAIMFPQTKFTLIDSIAKKIKVVSSIAQELKLENVICKTGRVEDLNERFDFITCRAVGRVDKIIPWVKNSLKKKSVHKIKNGFLFLKGGDLDEELSATRLSVQRIPISKFFEEEFFETKEIVYLSSHKKNKKS